MHWDRRRIHNAGDPDLFPNTRSVCFFLFLRCSMCLRLSSLSFCENHWVTLALQRYSVGGHLARQTTTPSVRHKKLGFKTPISDFTVTMPSTRGNGSTHDSKYFYLSSSVCTNKGGNHTPCTFKICLLAANILPDMNVHATKWRLTRWTLAKQNSWMHGWVEKRSYAMR